MQHAQRRRRPALFVTADQLARVEALRPALPGLRPQALFCSGGPALPAGWNDYEDWRAAQGASAPGIALIRGCALQHHLFVRHHRPAQGHRAHPWGRLDWAYDLGLALRYHSGARTLATLGLYSNISWVMMLCTLLAGGTLIVEPGFEAGRALRAIASAASPIPRWCRSSISVCWRMRTCAAHRPVLDAGDDVLRLAAAVGGEGRAVRKFLLRRDRALWAHRGHHHHARSRRCARAAWPRWASPVQGTDLKLIGDDGPGGRARHDPARSSGCTRFTMPGYWNRPDATGEATWTDAAGHTWLRTGDIGQLRRRRLPLHRRSQEGHDPLRRTEHLSRRYRGRAARAMRRWTTAR